MQNTDLIIKKCTKCSRLCSFLEENRKKFPDYFNNAVPSFGNINSEFLIVGLAPGLSGANKTGRPFTGDFAGDVLYNTLLKFKLASGIYEARADDNFYLVNTRVTNAVKCVPPENKPIGSEIVNCNVFLREEITNMCNLKIILGLGRIAHNAILKALNQSVGKFKFEHGKEHILQSNNRQITLFDSYHTSRYNINTNRLTLTMFEQVIAKIKENL